MAARVLGPLRRSPAFPLALAGLALPVGWAANEGGYPVTHWAPGGIVVLALVVVSRFSAGRFRCSRAARLGLAGLLAYAAWSYLSILWATEPGASFEGGDRALLYALLFALFAGSRLTAAARLALLCAFCLAMAGLALVVLLELDGMGQGDLLRALPGGRLLYPAGYVNAAPAQWMVAAFSAFVLARERVLPPPLRGLLFGAAVLLLDLALLSLSRGWMVASAVVLLLCLALLPGRLRTFYTALLVGATFAGALPFLLKVGERAQAGSPLHRVLVEATTATFLSAALGGLLFGLLAFFDQRRVAWGRQVALRRRLTVVAYLVGLALVGGGLAALGNPLAKAEHAWNSFTSTKGYAADNPHVNRLLAGFGSNRYDFYRVALAEWYEHPLLGLGSENFLSAYLKKGRSGETPRYPHSFELRALVETGLVGAALLLMGLGGALGATFRVLRGGDAVARAAAAAAFSGFLYWLVQGSFDWFWEYAGLAASAIALLGLAAGADQHRKPAVPPSKTIVAPALLPAAVAALAGAVAFALPWLSGLELESGAKVWRVDRPLAYRRLERASGIDPFSATPDLLAGTIAARSGERARATRLFKEALHRYPQEEYATLELGALASEVGKDQVAEAYFVRAHRLYPRGTVPLQALQALKASRVVRTAEVEAALATAARQFVA